VHFTYFIILRDGKPQIYGPDIYTIVYKIKVVYSIYLYAITLRDGKPWKKKENAVHVFASG